MKRLFTVLLVLVMALTLAACSSSNNDQPAGQAGSGRPVYRIGMECDYAPNNWQEDSATDTNMPIANLAGFYAEGYDVQMAKKIAEHMDADIEIVKLSWGGLIQALQEGQIDMIIAGMGDTPERKESISFSETYSTHKTEYVLVVKADSQYANAASIQDFSGATVIGQVNTYYDSAIDQIEGVNHATPATDVPNMVEQLAQGMVDALVEDDEGAIALYANDPEYKILFFEGENAFVVEMSGACVGIRLEDTQLVDQVNEALRSIDHETRVAIMEAAMAAMPQ